MMKTFKNTRIVVLDCEHIDKIDFTAAQGLHTVMKDFREQNHRLIMLRPSAEVLRCLESFSQEPILVAKSDHELVAVLKEFSGSKRIRETSIEVVDLANEKSLARTRGELSSTHL